MADQSSCLRKPKSTRRAPPIMAKLSCTILTSKVCHPSFNFQKTGRYIISSGPPLLPSSASSMATCRPRRQFSIRSANRFLTSERALETWLCTILKAQFLCLPDSETFAGTSRCGTLLERKKSRNLKHQTRLMLSGLPTDNSLPLQPVLQGVYIIKFSNFATIVITIRDGDFGRKLPSNSIKD